MITIKEEINLSSLLDQKVLGVFYYKDEKTKEIVGLEIIFDKETLQIGVDPSDHTFKLVKLE